MDQLNQGLAISLNREEAAPYVREAHRQIEEWGLRMPAVEPLVMDFGLGQFSAIGEIEFWIANEDAAGYCGKFLYMQEGQTCPNHMHKEKLETFFIVKGRIQMQYDAESLMLSSGDTLRVETGKYHEFTASEPTLILEVSKPSIIADNYFENPRIPIGGNFAG
jgi:mannose-6-phosphate isomerase-like protein (cupin superfamily)